MTSRSLPLLVLAIAACAAYLAASFVPYRVDTDIGFQLRSIQQWVRGESPTPATLRLPDPEDLSQDRLLWSNWWPPGFPFLYAPLAALGLRLATAVRLASFLLFLLGSLGWLRLAARVALPRWVAVLFALSLLGYGLSLGGAATLRTGDQLAYAGGPWVALLALHYGREGAGGNPAGGLFLAGLALGATYWLRYSLFVAALPLLLYVAARSWRATRPPGARLRRLALLGLGFALPVAALFLLNLAWSDNLAESLTGTRSAWDISRDPASRPFALAVSFLGSPGLALFQSDQWLTHLTYFSDRLLPFLRGLGNRERIVLKSLLPAPLTGLLFWSLLRARRRVPGPLPALALAATAGFFLALTAISVGVHYNYLGNEAARFAAAFMPMVHPLVLAAWLTPGERTPSRRERALAACVLLLLAAQVLFTAANFLKNDLYDRRATLHAAGSAGLFTPEIGREVPAVQATVASLLRSPQDAVVVAGPVGWGSAFIMWLDLPGRVLPVATFYEPLGARYLDAANLRGTRPYATRSPMRVVLVVSRTLLPDGWLAKLQARFPQAREWRTAPDPKGAEVVISYADLDAGGTENR